MKRAGTPKKRGQCAWEGTRRAGKARAPQGGARTATTEAATTAAQRARSFNGFHWSHTPGTVEDPKPGCAARCHTGSLLHGLPVLELTSK